MGKWGFFLAVVNDLGTWRGILNRVACGERTRPGGHTRVMWGIDAKKERFLPLFVTTISRPFGNFSLLRCDHRIVVTVPMKERTHNFVLSAEWGSLVPG